MEDKEFVRYVSLYQNMVYRVANSFIKNAADSEDITQDVFLKLYRSHENFEKDENVKAWLIRVTVNASKDYLKSAWLQKRATLEESIVTDSVKDDLGIKDAMNRMNGKYRMVLYLYYYEGYSVKEIAGLLGISEANTKMRLKRGREALKNILEE